MNEDVVVDVWGLLSDRLHVHVLLVEFLLQILDIAPVLHIDETDRSHVLTGLFGGGVATLPHQDVVLLVSAYHAT